jgi:hypothetical protein
VIKNHAYKIKRSYYGNFCHNLAMDKILEKTNRLLLLRNYSPGTRKAYLLYIKIYHIFLKIWHQKQVKSN